VLAEFQVDRSTKLPVGVLANTYIIDDFLDIQLIDLLAMQWINLLCIPWKD
jgi:hypothetical protein